MMKPTRGRHRTTRTTWQKTPGVAFLIIVHAAPIAALIGGATIPWQAFAVMYVFVAMSVGIGLHRYFAHRAFKTSRAFQFLLGLWTTTTFTDPIGFAGKHRIHHKYSDMEEDPHGPRSGFWHCWFGNLLDEGYTNAEVRDAVRDFTKYPELMLLHRYFWIPGVLLGTAVYLVAGLPYLAIGYCGTLALLLNLTSSINYFCHIVGSRRYDTNDRSRNNVIVAILTFGEGWHNNHHHYPTTARAGFFWWEFDPVYLGIRLLALFGIVWDVREVPTHVLHAESPGA